MTYRFGIYAFEDIALSLTRSDRPVPLEPEPARALALLLSRAGTAISSDDLALHVWGAGTRVDFDRTLPDCVGQLRAALGDSADNPRFVQTLPRRGFMFTAPVTSDGPAVGMRREPAIATATPVTVPPWIAAAAIAAVVLLIAGAGALMVARDRPLAPGVRRPIVAVATFENESGDPSHDRVMAGLSEAIVEKLTAIGPARLGVDGTTAILRRPRDARDWRAVARDTRASFLVSGQLQRAGDRLSLLMELTRLDDGTHVWVRRVNRPAGDPLDTLDADATADIEAAVRSAVLR